MRTCCCAAVGFFLAVVAHGVSAAETAEDRLNKGGHALHRTHGDDFRFIQIGAYVGATQKDPIFLKAIKHGWSGVLVEPVPAVFHQLKANYQAFSDGDIDRFSFENSAVCNGDREDAPFYFLSPDIIETIVRMIGEERREELPNWAAQASSLSRDQMITQLKAYFQLNPDQAEEVVAMAEIAVPCISYDSLVRKYSTHLRGKSGALGIHYIHIDAEGYDWNIVNEILNSKHDLPDMLCYESHHLTDAKTAARHRDALASNDYMCEQVNHGDDTCCYHKSSIATTLSLKHLPKLNMDDGINNPCQAVQNIAISLCITTPGDQNSFLIGHDLAMPDSEQKILLMKNMRVEWTVFLPIHEETIGTYFQDLSLLGNASFHFELWPVDFVLQDGRVFHARKTMGPWYDRAHHRLVWHFGANLTPLDVFEGEMNVTVLLSKIYFGPQHGREVGFAGQVFSSVRVNFVSVYDEPLEHFTTTEPVLIDTRARAKLSILNISTQDHLQRYMKMVGKLAFDSLHSRERQLTLLTEGVIFYLQKMMEYVILNNIEGDFVEAGAWRGGLCAIMAAVITAYGQQATRRVWCADSFKGFPDLVHPMDVGLKGVDKLPDIGSVAAGAPSVDAVQQKLSKFDFSVAKEGSDDSALIQLVPGFFNDTLPTKGMLSRTVAFLHVDGDLYSSVTDTLNAIVTDSILAPGAPIIIDDYHWHSSEAAKKATLDFRRKHGIKETLFCADKGPVFWFHTSMGN